MKTYRPLMLSLALAVPLAAQAQDSVPAAKPAAPGVIVPQTDVDPGIAAKPPSPAQASPMPVIPPPGAPGNSAPAQPR